MIITLPRPMCGAGLEQRASGRRFARRRSGPGVFTELCKHDYKRPPALVPNQSQERLPSKLPTSLSNLQAGGSAADLDAALRRYSKKRQPEIAALQVNGGRRRGNLDGNGMGDGTEQEQVT